MRDAERLERIKSALEADQLDALVCALPVHVLLLTGYWPVLGTSIAIATRDGQIGLLAPEDERDLAESAGVDPLLTFTTGSIEAITSTSELAIKPLRQLAAKLGLRRGRVGYEASDNVVPSTYASMHTYGFSIERVVRESVGADQLVAADDLLYRLLAVKTPAEITRIKAACQIAERAFHLGSERLQAGMTEAEAAINFRLWLSTWRDNPLGTTRCDGFVFCMSGENAAEANRTFMRTRDRVIRGGDLVVVHCNNYAEGYWTDITRTYCVGEPNHREQQMFHAVFEARKAAIAAIKPGTPAAEVYAQTQQVMVRSGFEKHSQHAIGHGVGFHAINHNARPVLHPKSNDVLEEGMVFNLVPAVYIKGHGGLRHCDMVAVTKTGAEVLTPFQAHPYALQILAGAGY